MFGSTFLHDSMKVKLPALVVGTFVEKGPSQRDKSWEACQNMVGALVFALCEKIVDVEGSV